MSIKNKLALTISVLCAVLLCGVAAVLIQASETQLREGIVTQHIAMGKALTYSFDQQILGHQKMLVSVASGLTPETLSNPARLQDYLATKPALLTVFSNILVYSPDGVVIAAWPTPEKYIGNRQLVGREYIVHTRESRKPYISRLFVSPISHKPLMVFTAPILDHDGNVIAIVGGAQHLLENNMFAGFTQTHVGRTGSLFMATPDHTVISTPVPGRLLKPLGPGIGKLADEALKSGEATGTADTHAGVRCLVTLETMQTTGLLVGVVLPVDEAFAPIRVMRLKAAAWLGVLILMLPLLIWWMARWMTQPLLLLRDRVQAMARSPQADILVALDRSDEIGELALSFDGLTQARRSAEGAQLRLNRALRMLSSCSQALVQARNEQRLLQDICDLLATHGGYAFAWIGYVDAGSDPKGTDLVIHAQAQAGSGTWSHESQPIRGVVTNISQLTRLALRAGKAQVCQEIVGSPLFASSQAVAASLGHHSCISLPLMNEQGAFGVLNIYATESHAFSDSEIELLQELATDLAFGIKTLRDRTAHQAAEAELAFLAHHDPLTKLPNRLLLRDRFERAALAADRNGNSVAMLFLDLDNFKEVNDSLGHGVGDELLVRVVQRLQGALNQVDTISREGGDEFIVLLSGIDAAHEASEVAKIVLEAMAQPFEIDHYTLHTSVSVGISMYPDDGDSFDAVRKNADTALYRAKDDGRRSYRFFAERMNTDARMRMQIQMDLRKALQNREFELHYQPQIELRTGLVVGIEALIRWRRNGELVPPAEFIPTAEHSGLIIPIGEWVLGEACRQAAEWRRQGLPRTVMAVNLSALQFKHGNIADTVQQVLQASGLPADLLELELTESILLQDVDAAINTLHNLKVLGVHLSIDDFGTGYSSLSYLKRLAVDKLKIDRSFIRDVTDDADDAAIVKAIIQLSHTLLLHVVAEGVENADQCKFLQQCGCDEAQGFLFSKPVPASEIPGLVAGWREALLVGGVRETVGSVR